MVSVEFGEKLQSFRKRLGLSQSSLAGRAGLSDSSISRIESGGRNPTKKRIRALASVLNLSEIEQREFMLSAGFAPQDLLYEASRVKSESPAIKRLAEVLNDHQLTLKEKQELEDMVIHTIFYTIFKMRGEDGVRVADNLWFEITGEHYLKRYKR